MNVWLKRKKVGKYLKKDVTVGTFLFNFIGLTTLKVADLKNCNDRRHTIVRICEKDSLA